MTAPVTRSSRRPPGVPAEAAVDGWQRIFEWYGRYLAGD